MSDDKQNRNTRQKSMILEYLKKTDRTLMSVQKTLFMI